MEVQKNIPLKKYTTFQIGGPAAYFCVAKTKDDIIEALAFSKAKKIPFFILGGGSNLLVSDKGYGGIVIKIENCKLKIPACRQAGKTCKVITDAGVSLTKIVGATANAGLQGMEWAAGIPGTLGGAVRGNAGAFEGEMKNIISEVEVFNIKSGKIKILKNKKCGFGYRDSIFKKKKNLIILSAELRLKKGNKKIIKQKIKKYLDYRQEKHPWEPSAGSIFKKVGSTPAAILIQRAGLSGKKIGGAVISKKHTNFIVNSGGATAKDVLRLINLVKRKIKNKFGKNLKEEIQYLK